jgi:FMN-dependent NADH-azoreductase
MNILHIDSCALGDHSASRQLTASAVAALLEGHDAARVIYRDLAAAPLSHVSGPLMQVMRQQWNKAIPMNAELRAEVLQSESLLQEFIDADMLVLGAPMCNYSIPSTLKAWLDRLLETGRHRARSGGTVNELVHGKRVFLISTPSYALGDKPQPEMLKAQEEHLKALFNLVGISKVETFQSEVGLQQQLDALLHSDAELQAA